MNQGTDRTRMGFIPSYDVDEHGYICNPGKFEGEPLYVPYLWECVLNGDGETVDDPDQRDATMDLVMLSGDDKRHFPRLARSDIAILWEDNNGFVYCDLTTTKEYKDRYESRRILD
jgi:hypothetical protein